MPPIPQPIFNQNMKMLQHAADPSVAVEEEQRHKLEAAEKDRLEAEEAAKESENDEESDEPHEEEEKGEEDETDDDQR